LPTKEFGFGDLPRADLVVDGLYKGGPTKNVASDPLARLLPCGNQGGIRAHRRRSDGRWAFCVLFSSFADPDWPDTLDVETGQLVYFGDNKSPGHALHETPRRGNQLLRDAYAALHARPSQRATVPPFFVFDRGDGWDVRFRGLAVPGYPGLAATDDLVAVWKASRSARFQNYRAILTILDCAAVPRAWIDDLVSGDIPSLHASPAWTSWAGGRPAPVLRAPRAVDYRTKAEQLPAAREDVEIVRVVYEYFRSDPFAFEACAVEIARLMDSRIQSCDLTRRYVDGGRDAVGTYYIGNAGGGIRVEFALEAKCYAPSNPVGVEDVARLISRLRFRQFGILVTTSFLGEQAYKEVRQDGHPVVILSARDIAGLLKSKGIGTSEAVGAWLRSEFPTDPRSS